MTLPQVRKAEASDRQAVLDTITLAFAADPLMRWIFPNGADYMASFRELVNLYAGVSVDEKSCYLSANGEGAALWLPPGVHGDEDALEAFLESVLPKERFKTFGTALETMDSYHPDDEDCWYLAFIGVDCGHQRKGFGATMMKHVTSMLDEHGYLGYLESSNPENIGLYQRHGFEIMGEIRIGDVPVVTPMVRDRRG